MNAHCEHCADLVRRVAALEEMVFRTSRTRRAILRVLASWPGPFTVQQIQQALSEYYPDVAREMKPHAVSNTIKRLEKSGHVILVNEGKGQVAAIYETVGEINPEEGRRGAKYGRRANYESGFRNIIRRALPDLPDEFTLDDVRQWIKDNLPGVRIPYGTWSSTLYKLQQQGELVVVKNRGKNVSVNRKVYARGPVRVAPTGEEVRELQAAWEEFRKRMMNGNNHA